MTTNSEPNQQGQQGQGDGDGSDDSPVIRQLREKAEKADQLEQQVAEMQRREAVREAGVDTSKPVYELFEKAFDGDWADTEAVKEAAQKYGLIADGEQDQGQGGAQPQQPQQAQTPAPEQQAHQAIQGASGGGQPPGQGGPDLSQAGSKEELLSMLSQAGEPLDYWDPNASQ